MISTKRPSDLSIQPAHVDWPRIVEPRQGTDECQTPSREGLLIFARSAFARMISAGALAFAAPLALLLPTAASALGAFALEIEYADPHGSGFDHPRVYLDNVSTEGETIVAFEITLGDQENYFIDFVPSLLSTPVGDKAALATEDATGATLAVGDRVRDGQGTTRLGWAFEDFEAGEGLVFDAEVTRATPVDDAWLEIDSRSAFVPDTGHPNAFVTVLFGDGTISRVDFETPEESIPESFQLYGEGSLPASAPIPEPSAALLFAVGLATAGLRRSPRSAR